MCKKVAVPLSQAATEQRREGKMHSRAGAGNYLKPNISVSKTQQLITALKGHIGFASVYEALEFALSLYPLDFFE